MNKEDDEKIKEDLERLRSMSPEDAMEIVGTYHTTFIKKLTENLDTLKQIQKLCPSMIPVTKTVVKTAGFQHLRINCKSHGCYSVFFAELR